MKQITTAFLLATRPCVRLITLAIGVVLVPLILLGQAQIVGQNSFAEIMARAIAEDPKAQNELGVRYFAGNGVPKNEAEALKWFRRAADKGHAKAQFNLAKMYENGLGVPQDEVEAVKWYRTAADQGYVSAQEQLGWMYLEGIGVSKDHAEALKWYRKAADQGDAKAQFNLARMYEKGLGGRRTLLKQ